MMMMMMMMISFHDSHFRVIVVVVGERRGVDQTASGPVPRAASVAWAEGPRRTTLLLQRIPTK